MSDLTFCILLSMTSVGFTSLRRKLNWSDILVILMRVIALGYGHMTLFSHPEINFLLLHVFPADKNTPCIKASIFVNCTCLFKTGCVHNMGHCNSELGSSKHCT